MENFLNSAKKQFHYYKLLGEKTMARLQDNDLFWQYNDDSNSIAMIIQHLWGNMLSRWTDFLTTDGEKEWRKRDLEFEAVITTRQELTNKWNAGWDCLLDALKPLTGEDLQKIIYIRNQGHTVMEAINRQLAHYPYHVGQIVFIAKMIADSDWQSLSIPKGGSQSFNADKFSKPKSKQHFTDEFLKKDTK